MSREVFRFYLSSLICFVPMLLAVTIWNELPERINVHFNMSQSGAPNFQVGKLVAFIVTPIFYWCIHLLMIYLYNHHRREFGMSNLHWLHCYSAVPVVSLLYCYVIINSSF